MLGGIGEARMYTNAQIKPVSPCFFIESDSGGRRLAEIMRDVKIHCHVF